MGIDLDSRCRPVQCDRCKARPQDEAKGTSRREIFWLAWALGWYLEFRQDWYVLCPRCIRASIRARFGAGR